MQFIDKVENLKHTYKTCRTPITPKLDKGTLYMPLMFDSKKFASFVGEFISKNYTFMPNKTKTIYTPKRIDTKIGSTMIRVKHDYVNYGKSLKTDITGISSVFTTMDQIRDNNVIIDITTDMSEIMKRGMTKVKDVLNVLEHIATRCITEKHKYKYIIVNVDRDTDISVADIKVDSYKNISDPLDLILFAIKRFPKDVLSIFEGSCFVFMSDRGLVTMVCDAEDTKLYSETLDTDIDASITLEGLLKDSPNVETYLETLSPFELPMQQEFCGKLRHKIVTYNEATAVDSLFRQLIISLNKIRVSSKSTKVESLEDGENIIINEESEESEDIVQRNNNIALSRLEDSIDIAIVPDNVDELGVDELNKIMKDVNDSKVSRSREITPKEKRMMDRMESVGLVDKVSTANELAGKIKSSIIPTSTFDVDSLDDIGTNKFINFNATYRENLYKSDLVKIAKSFADTDTPMYIQKMTLEDGTDESNYQDKLTMRFKDADGKPHSAALLIPKLYKDKFMIINGTEKTLIGQMVVKPIIKDRDEVIITTDYNKAFMTHKGGRYYTPKHSKLARGLVKIKDTKKKTSISFGGSKLNLDCGKLPFEYILIGNVISRIKSDKHETDLIFHIDTLCDEIYNTKLGEFTEQFSDTKLNIGKFEGEDIFYDMDTDRVVIDLSHENSEVINGMNLIDFTDMVVNTVEPKLHEELIAPISSIPNMVGTYIKVLHKDIPLIFFLIHTDGISTVLERAGIEYKIYPKTESSKKPRIDKYSQMLVELADCYLIFELDSVETITLLSPLKKIDMAKNSISLSELNEKASTATLIEELVSSTNTALYLDNYRNNLINPTIQEVLGSYNMPTDFIGVMTYANTLLATGVNEDDQDLNNVRYRSAEIMTSLVYNVLADAHSVYAAQIKRGSTRAKFSVDKNAVIKKDLPNVKEYSFNNPLLEQMEINSVSWKGPSGINVARAYGVDRRLYKESHYGILSTPSAYSGSIGIVKQLAIDPKIKDARGFLDVAENLDDVDNMDSKHLWSVSQHITQGSANHAEAQRDMMNHGQKGHTIAIENADPSVVTDGYDQLLPHMSTQYANVAEQDGTIVAIKECYVTVKYKDGTTDTFPMSDPGRNAAKSKFIDNAHVLRKKVNKVGKKFKKGDLLTYNKYFYKDIADKVTYTAGTMGYVALHSMPGTYEDSTIICETLGNSMATRNIYDKSIKLDKDTKLVDAITSIGSKVKAGDSLVKWNNGTIDAGINKYLDLHDIKEANLQDKKIDKGGEIVDIRVFYACEKSDLSSSMKKYVNSMEAEISRIGGDDYTNKAKDSVKLIKSRSPKKVKVGTKVLGHKLDKGDVLITYYTRVVDVFSQGDKMTYYGALKGIGGTVYPDNMMPVTEDGIRVDAMLSVFSPLGRKTTEVYIVGWTSRASLGLAKYLQIALGVKPQRNIFNNNQKEKNIKIPKMSVAQAKKFIYGFYDVIDRTGTNTKMAKERYNDLSDKAFADIVGYGHFPVITKPYEIEPTIEDAVAAVEYVGEKSSSKITLPFMYIDEETGEALISDKEVTVIAVPLNRLQQQITSENASAYSLDARDKTNQVIGDSKAASFAANEENALIAKGYDATIKELKTIRADHTESKDEAYAQASSSGIMNLPESINDPKNKQTLQYIHHLWLSGLGIAVDYVEDLDQM